MNTMRQPLASLDKPLLGRVLTALLRGMLLATWHLTLFDLRSIATANRSGDIGNSLVGGHG